MSAFHRLPAEKLSVGPNQHLSYSKVAPTTTAASNNAYTFVCVAGLGETRYTFRNLAPLLAQAGHTVYMVDLRGMGDSSTTFSSYSIEDNTADLEVLLSTIDGKVVGNNFAAACIVLVKAPNVVGSMILSPFVRDMVGVEANILHAIAPVLLARPFGVATWMSFWASLFRTRAPDFDAYAAYLRANLKEEVPPQADAYYIHDMIGTTEKQVIMYPSVKHYPHTECPDAVAADLVHFVNQL
ncbi:hypothetical protein AC1031_008277 [Aphanomyces cochlioides]|nr:hypothetical protein AC1031_008277 [Aphanomyces cochlioides]